MKVMIFRTYKDHKGNNVSADFIGIKWDIIKGTGYIIDISLGFFIIRISKIYRDK